MFGSGIFETQQLFQNEDLVNDSIKQFHSILVKYYRVERSTLSSNQRVIQPIFAKSGHSFSQLEGLCISEIASDRSGNERVVRLSKQSGYINRGVQPAGSLLWMDNAWMAWSF